MRIRFWRPGRAVWPVWALTAGLAISEALNDWRLRREPPDEGQSIAAVLVSWGFDLVNTGNRPSEAEITAQIAKLDSPNSEERVRAAWWLGARGVRLAGPAIATAMSARGTGRPCQLAHQLGKLAIRS